MAQPLPAPTFGHAAEAFVIAHTAPGAWAKGTAVKYRQTLTALDARLAEYDPAAAADVAVLGTPAGASALDAAFTAAFGTLAPATRARHLAALRRITGDYRQAADLLEQALTIRREIGDRDGEAEILNHQGALLCTSGDLAKARERHLHALELARGVGNPLEEARALAGTGRCAIAMRITDGPADLRKALEIFRRIGAAEAVDLTAVDDLHPAHTGSGWTPAEN